ncbi:MAG: adenylate/guanylate cyclase domain-containing protein [Actinomycetota bacterium]|nr:adenylate/guanylate cyclase domain-containing protein [Actinomycetota bacterium]
MSKDLLSWLRSCPEKVDEAIAQVPPSQRSGGSFGGELSEVAAALEATKWACLICDPDWNLVWVSKELKELLGETDEERLGLGKHIYAAWMSDTWMSAITDESKIEAFLTYIPYVLAETPGGRKGLVPVLGEGFDELLEAVEPVAPPPVWQSSIEFLRPNLPPARVTELALRIRGNEGNSLGTVFMYGSSLPAHVLDLVSRGDAGMFARMARLTEPGPREAAVVFADIQDSVQLSLRMPSASYFELIRSVTTAIDEVIVSRTGIVGKHAGDGVTGFFLADDLSSASRAVRAAIEAATEMATCVKEAAQQVDVLQGILDPSTLLVNVGVHWGGRLYMGQLVTGGRLEVTALGDPVNQCARIQQAARDGEVLASKDVLEHLDQDDAAALGINPDGVIYRTVAELPGAPEKAIRDAGGIPVTSL